MINLRFSRLPKYRKFKYTPVYYDEQKEELHARVQEVKREMGDLKTNENRVKDNIRKLYNAKQNSQRYGTTSQKNYLLRLGTIILLLSAISYKLLNSNVLEFVIKGFTK
jgi:hypothetical protein|tara:strand:- start:4623 stop:4949 length:327 start_codon:yes stop_codon:yes gene_type:complete